MTQARMNHGGPVAALSLAAGLLAASAPAQAASPAVGQASAQGSVGKPKGPGFDAADLAYKAYAAGDYRKAAAGAAQAVRLEPGEPGYRALLIDALSAVGDIDAADRAAADAETTFGRTTELSLKRGYFAAKLHRFSDAADAFGWALGQGDLPPDRARAVRLDYSDALIQAGHARQAADALAPLAAEPAYDVQSRRAVALSEAGDLAAASPAYEQAAALAPTPRDRALMLQARIQSMVQLGQKVQARELFERELASGAFAPVDPVDVGLTAISVGDDKSAQAQFQRDPSSPKLTGAPALDAAYSAKRDQKDAAAIRYFQRGLDSAAAGDLTLSPDVAYAIRRDVADISRVWGFNGLVSYGMGGVAAGGGAPISGGRGVTQAGGEAYARLGGYRNGASVEVFARVFGTVAAENGDQTGPQTTQGWLGLRWKPFRQSNLVLEGSRMIKLGSQARDDWMVRAAYSAGQGMDLPPQTRSRPMWNLYGDVSRILDHRQTLAVVDARAGWAYRFGSGDNALVLAPFVGVNYAHDSSFADQDATGAGPGLALRRWFGATPYKASPSYVEATVQARARLSGDRRAEGVFATFAVVY